MNRMLKVLQIYEPKFIIITRTRRTRVALISLVYESTTIISTATIANIKYIITNRNLV
jgi:hypothetical protein